MVGTPAYEAGIQAGDLIVRSMAATPPASTWRELSELLRGEPGWSGDAGSDARRGKRAARCSGWCGGEIKVDTVLGDTRKPDDTWNFFLPGHDRIGYVRITSFGDRTAEECRGWPS